MGDPSRGVLAKRQAVLRFGVRRVWSRPSGSARASTVFINAATRVIVV